jgi:hypothetical protein
VETLVALVSHYRTSSAIVALILVLARGDVTFRAVATRKVIVLALVVVSAVDSIAVAHFLYLQVLWGLAPFVSLL